MKMSILLGQTSLFATIYSLKKMLGYFNPILGLIWTNPAVWLNLKNAIYNPTIGFVHI